MPTVIIVTNGNIESYYSHIMEYLDAKYHRFPTSFQDFPIGDEVLARSNSYNAMASEIGVQAANMNVPLGKLVL